MKQTSRLRWVGLVVVALAVVLAMLWKADESGRAERSEGARPEPGLPDFPRRELEHWDEHAEGGRGPAVRADESRTVSGIVRDAETGVPIVGARVIAVDVGTERTVAASRAVETDAEGQFELFEFPPAPTHVQASAAGYLHTLVAFPRQREDRVEVTLGRGQEVRGKVVDDEERPVSGARVWLHREQNQVAWRDAHPRVAVGDVAAGGQAVTDDRGDFHVLGLGPGPYVVRATKQGWSFPAWEEPPIVEAGQHGVKLRLLPIRTLVIRHFDSQSRTPLHCVMTQVRRYRETKAAIPITADLGRGEALLGAEPEGFDSRNGITRISFAWLDSVSDGPVFQTVYCKAPGYEPFQVKVDCSVPGPEIVVDAPMKRRTTRLGTLKLAVQYDATGLPFTGRLQLMIDDQTGEGRGLAIRDFRDGAATRPLELPEGQYKIRPMGCGDVGFWWIQAGRWALVSATGGVETRGVLTVSGNPLRLNVVDRLGRTVRGYDLKIFPASGMMGGVRRWDTPGNHVWLQRWAEGYAGPDVILPPGTAKITVSLAGEGRSTAEVELSGDGTAHELTLTLE
jgi:hypothetical protein